MFDLTQPKNKVNQKFAIPKPSFTTSSTTSQGPRVDLSSKSGPIQQAIKPPTTQSFPQYQFRSAHSPSIQPPKPNYGAAWARGTLGSVPGKLLTPVAEKIFDRKFDINTLPESNTFGEKALQMVGHLGADLPLWLGGEMMVAKPLAALAKTKPITKAISAIPKAIKPALNTGVRAGATYGAVVAPAETLVNKEGLEGLVEREKLLPVMALGGTALHGAGQLAVKGIGKGISSAREAIRPIGVPPAPYGPPRPTYSTQRRSGLGPLRTNDVIPLEQGLGLSSTVRKAGQSNPLVDAQNAYRNPIPQASPISRSVQRGANLGPLKLSETRTPAYKARQAELSETFKDLPIGSVDTPMTRKTLQGSIDESMGIGGQRGAYEGLDAFGKPIKTFKKNTDTQDAVAEISTKMTKQLNDIAKSLKQADKQTPIESIRKKVKDMGGIKQVNDGIFEERRVIPNWIRNDKSGRPLDEVADTLGMTSDDLLVAINDSSRKIRNYAAEAQAMANKDPEYLALSNTLETLRGGLPNKRTLPKRQGDVYYHGTNQNFNQFDTSKIGSFTGNEGIFGKGIYLTKNPLSANSFGDNMLSTKVNLKNPFKLDKNTSIDEVAKLAGVKPIKGGSYDTNLADTISQNPTKFTESLRKLGHDGVDFDGGVEVVVFNPKQIKINKKYNNLTMDEVTGLPDSRFNATTQTLAKADVKLKPRESLSGQPFGNSDKFNPQPIQPQRTTLSGSLPVDTPLARPVKKLTPVKKERLTWTNRDGLPIEPASLRPIPKEQTLKDVLASRVDGPIKPPKTVEQGPIRSKGLSREMPSSFKRETTVDLEIPMVNGRADVANAVEKIRPVRSVAASIGRPRATSTSASTRSPEPIRPQAEPPNRVFANDDGTIRPQINRDPKKGKTFAEMWKESNTHYIDDMAPLEKAERAVYGKLQSAEKSFYKQARLIRGNPEQAAEFVRSKLAPVIKSVEKQGHTVEDIGDYALAVHARDVNAKGINSGFSNERIANTIAKHGTPEMEAARKELLKINNELLDSLAKNGVIEKSLPGVLKEKWPNYMSLSRAFDDEKVEFASEMSKALANASSPIQRLKGSKRDVIDPIESMIKNIYKSTSTVDRNKIAAQLKGLAENDPSGQVVRRLAEGEEKSRLNTVYAMESGKKVYYEVQPDVYKALMGLDKDSANKFIKIFQKPASLLRAGATLTPEFSLRNPIRDIPAAYTVSNSGLNPIRDIPMALFDIFQSRRGKQTLYNQYLRDNAGYGNLISTDRKVLQEAMTDVLKEPTSKKFVNVVSGKSLLRLLRGIADVSENATKLGEYRAALRGGATRPEAAYRARDIMDFGRSGASVREVNKIVAFVNASLQGKSKIYRAIKEDPVGVTARAFKVITLPTIGAFLAVKYLANDVQKEIIENAPGWMTSTFWLVPVPGTDQVARIPKPFDLAPIFANLPEETMKYIFDNDPEAFDGFAKETIAAWSIPTMITGLVPIVEGMTGYSFFRQGQIIPQREEGLNFSDQYDARTTETAKLLAKGVNTLTGGQGAFKNFGSPRIMDNTIKGLTAGLGTYATSFADYIAETSGLVDKKMKPAKNISDKPLVRAFLVSESMGGKSTQEFYREKEELTKNKNSLKLQSPKAKFPEEKRLKKLNEVASEISDISKDIRKIENDKSMDPLVKRDKINALITKRNTLSKTVMK